MMNNAAGELSFTPPKPRDSDASIGHDGSLDITFRMGPSIESGARNAVYQELAVSFGAELKTERVRRQITLESVAEGTKVPTRHLRALEQDKFDLLPGGVFNKGIVRSYCRYVGLDESVWLERFPSVAPPEPTPDWVAFAENVRRNRESVSARLGAKWVGAMLMLAILAAACWVAWIYMVRPRLSEAPNDAVSHAAAAPAERSQ